MLEELSYSIARVLFNGSRAGPDKQGQDTDRKQKVKVLDVRKEKDWQLERDVMYVALLASRDPQQRQI